MRSQDELQRLGNQIRDLNNDIDAVERLDLNEIEATAQRYATQKSSVLAGIAGGIIGGSAGVAIGSLGLGGIAFGATVLTGPVGAAFGAVVFVLAWRGMKHQQLEREAEHVQIPLNVIRACLTIKSRTLTRLV